ncbi:MAG: MBL fold metallo-hydrolase [Candidatus Natronoplasma sp.]
MKGCITYWYHSCFTLELDRTIILFDYPDRGIDDYMDEQIKSGVDGSELYVFISHAHGDHFSPNVTKFSANAEKTNYVVSDDILEKRIFPQRSEASGNYSFTQVLPDQDYKIDDLRIKTFKSNDAGVAFLIDLCGNKIYYGGDLEKWNWPEWSAEKVREHVRVFEDVIKKLKNEEVDIAFSNMDERLPSWAGPVEFMEKVNPRYFIPMHTFGNEGWIEDLVNEEINAKSQIFHYEKPGDDFYCEL